MPAIMQINVYIWLYNLFIIPLQSNNICALFVLQAYSDHSDLVARRMGFIPLPLGVVMIRVITSCVKFQSLSTIIVGLVTYVGLFTFCINNNFIILMRACHLIDAHQQAQVNIH